MYKIIPEKTINNIDLYTESIEPVGFYFDEKEKLFWFKTTLYDYVFKTPNFDVKCTDAIMNDLEDLILLAKRVCVTEKTVIYLQTNDLPKYGLLMIDNLNDILRDYQTKYESLLDKIAKVIDSDCELKEIIQKYEWGC